MAITLTTMDPLGSLSLALHVSNVGIFRNTKAIDVPDKLNTVANSIKTYTNQQITNPVQTYVNESMKTVEEYVTTISTELETSQNNFISDMSNNISGYLDTGSAGYNVVQSRSLVETGETSDLTLDSEHRIKGVTQGAITTDNILYDGDDNVISFTETITADSISTSKNYVVTYDVNGLASTSVI